MMDNAIVKRRLPCQLTEMEMADAAMLAATRQAEYDKVEDEKKRVLARYTGRLKSLRGQMSTEATKATTGIEERSVECIWIVDRETSMAILRRSDNGEIVQERELTGREKQLSMMELSVWLEEHAEAPSAVDVDETPTELEMVDGGSDEESSIDRFLSGSDQEAPEGEAEQEYLPDGTPGPDAADDAEELETDAEIIDRVEASIEAERKPIDLAKLAPTPKWLDCPSCKGMMRLNTTEDGKPTVYACGCGYQQPADVANL